MKMKELLFKNHGILTCVGLVVLGLAVSCVSSSDQQFNDPNAPSEESASVQLLVTGIEGGARAEFDIYLRVVSVIGREIYYLEISDPRYTGELLTGPIDDNGFLLTRPWSARYRVVKDCNILLERAAAISDSQQRGGVEGYARTMMAYELLLNLNYADENGIRVDVGGDVLGQFVSKQQAFTSIAGMLDQALASLNGAGASFPFNMSSGFALFNTPATFAQFNRALKARVAAYMADWDEVLNALGGSFLDTGASLSVGAYHNYSTASGDLLNPVFEPPTASTVKWLAHPTFEADAEPGDARYSSKIFKRAAPLQQSGLSSDLAVTVASGSSAPFPIIRNEELILLRAEANIAQGNLTAAQSDINLIRNAAELGSVTLTSASQALDQVLHEKRYSLFSEGHRWIDMRRYGRLGQLPLDRTGDVVLSNMPIPFDENQ